MSNSSYDLFQKRLKTFDIQSEEGLNKRKVDTFKKALQGAYNSELFLIQKNNLKVKGMISEIDRVYKVERKKFATLLDYDCQIGDIIYWSRNESYWIITKHYETETAIFSGEISWAKHLIKWKDLNTGIVYETRASVTGPDQIKILENEKGYRTLDLPTDTISIIVSKSAQGIELLERYSTLIINNKKYIINVIDNITKDGLIILQAKETPINQDLDNIENKLTNDKVNISFTATSSLDDITEVELGSQIPFEITLFKNNSIVSGLDFIYYLTNCRVENNILHFETVGNAVISVYYEDIQTKFTYNFNVMIGATPTINIKMIGSETVKTLTKNLYKVEYLGNGIPSPIIGTWSYDMNYADIISIGDDYIELKLKNKTGNFILTFDSIDGILNKTITVIPITGGRQ